jgi:hypothetical protein
MSGFTFLGGGAPPGKHLGLFCGKKNIKFSLPLTIVFRSLYKRELTGNFGFKFMQPLYPEGGTHCFLLPAELNCIELASPPLRQKVETKTLISNMLSTNWKTFIAARVDNTAGNKNTSVFTEAWLPEKNLDQCFQTLTADPDLVLFATDSNKNFQSSTVSRTQEALCSIQRRS